MTATGLMLEDLALSADRELSDLAAECYNDPLQFVLTAYPWGEPGTSLERFGLDDGGGPDTWQREFLIELGQDVRARGFDGVHHVPPIRKAVSSGHGIGKLQPLDAEIYTPDGLRRWGDLVPGDYVFAEDGSPTRILARHDHGVMPIWRVTFDDGSAVDVGPEHLWKVKGRQERRCGRGWRVMTTAEIAAAGVRRLNGAASARQWEIPRQGPAQFPSRATPIPPYVLGLWLGDGGRRTANIHCPDREARQRAESLGEVVTADVGGLTQDGRVKGFRLQCLESRLRDLGISDLYSHERYVPGLYCLNDIDARAEVLRGLLDTDGEADKSGSVVFSSCSHRLAEDVVWLARSLGGKARFQPSTKRGAHRRPDGHTQACRECWRVTITMPPGFRCFYVERKQVRSVSEVQDRYLARWVDRIEPIGESPAMCITVEHPSHCYLANNFVVTHNSAMAAWLVNWIMATRPFCQGTITANSYTQLRDKTWARVQTWTRLCVFREWFVVNADRMFHRDHKDSWFCAPQSCRKENSEAFAGQHAVSSTSFYLFDEASAVPEAIYEVSEGGLTDGESMIFLFGNPTRSTGAFHRAVFGSQRTRWVSRTIDARDSAFTNKELIAEWVQDYGEDSDFCRVRVRGLPPRASDLQYIDSESVYEAQQRDVATLSDDPLIVGFDVARGGADSNVFWFRCGSDARSTPPVIIPGELTRDTSLLVTKAAEILTSQHNGRPVKAMFVDGTGIGGPIVDRLQQLGHRNVVEVQFSSAAPDDKYANMRAYMWGRMRNWLVRGAIPALERLETDLTGPHATHDSRDRLLLESKESMKRRDLSSPDYGDALALTFAAPVLSKQQRQTQGRRRGRFEGRTEGTSRPGTGTEWMH